MKKVNVLVEQCDNVKEHLEDLPENDRKGHKYLIDRFKSFKEIEVTYSTDNFPTTNEYTQTMYPSSDLYLGRDRGFDRPPYLKTEMHIENIKHTHVNDGTWKPHTKQWEQKSSLAIIYSAFTWEESYYFYILELLLDTSEDAHEYYRNYELLEEWLEDAKTYRLSVQKN